MRVFDRIPPRYLVPNALTAASLLLALVSIFQSLEQNYTLAAWLIVWCALLDIADGKVAKWMRATSEFGLQFDSLADVMAFCAAPAVLVYSLLTSDPRFSDVYSTPAARGVLAALAGFYLLMGTLRLARYNLKIYDIGTEIFAGLPTTIAGTLVATYLLAAWEIGLPDVAVEAMPIVLLLLGVMMISTMPLPRSTGGGSSRGKRSLLVLVVIVYTLGALQMHAWLLFVVALAYPLVGFAIGALQRRRTKLRDADRHSPVSYEP